MDNIKDDKYFVNKILECIDAIEKISENKSTEELEENILINNAIMFQFTLIGEYTTRLTDKYKKNKENIPWQKIKGLRNNIVHDYEGVMYSRIKQTIDNDLLMLKKELEK